jgi:hypothetical protein
MRGTTPHLTFTLPFDTSLINVLWITFSQNNVEVFTIEKSDCQLKDDVISVKLKQKQTLMLNNEMPLEIQLRINDGNDALTSDIIKTTVGRILKDGEI